MVGGQGAARARRDGYRLQTPHGPGPPPRGGGSSFCRRRARLESLRAYGPGDRARAHWLDDKMRAVELYDNVQKDDPAGAEAIALAYLDETGQLPENVWDSLGAPQRDQSAMWKRLLGLRGRAFRARRLEAPEAPG